MRATLLCIIRIFSAQQHKPTREENRPASGGWDPVRCDPQQRHARTQSLSSPWESVAGCVVLIQQQQQQEGVTGEVIWLGGGGAVALRSAPRLSAGPTRLQSQSAPAPGRARQAGRPAAPDTSTAGSSCRPCVAAVSSAGRWRSSQPRRVASQSTSW